MYLVNFILMALEIHLKSKEPNYLTKHFHFPSSLIDLSNFVYSILYSKPSKAPLFLPLVTYQFLFWLKFLLIYIIPFPPATTLSIFSVFFYNLLFNFIFICRYLLIYLNRLSLSLTSRTIANRLLWLNNLIWETQFA